MRNENCEYENDGQRITQPGKFEGEPVFAPHFWQLGLEGFCDDDDGEYFGFSLNSDDWKRWPELNGKNRVALREDSSGFVHTYVYP